MPILGLIILTACVLRFYGLDAQSLWSDELGSWRRSGFESLREVLETGVRTEIWPPTYHILLHLVQRYAGASETILRLPSAVAGVLAVFGVFLTGRRLYSHREGLIAAAFTAVLWCPVYYSQEARGYQILLLSSVLAVFFWLSVLRRLDQGAGLRRWETAGYVVSAILTAYLHYAGLYLIGIQGLYAFLMTGGRRKPLLGCGFVYGLILAAYVPWIPTMLYQMSHNVEKSISWILAPSMQTIYACLKHPFNKSAWFVAVAAVLYVFLAARSLRGWRWTRRAFKTLVRSPGFLLASWLVLPFLGALITSWLWTPVLTPRNFVLCVPAAYILLSRALTRLPIAAGGQALVAVVLVGVSLWHLLSPMAYYRAPHKTQFREATAFILARDHPDSWIVFVRPIRAMHFSYYCPRGASESACAEKLAAPKFTRDIVGLGQARLAAKRLGREGPRYVWLLHEPGRGAGMPTLMEESGLVEVAQREFYGIEARLFENRSRPRL